MRLQAGCFRAVLPHSSIPLSIVQRTLALLCQPVWDFTLR